MATRRNPRLPSGDKAVITKAARKRAGELNEKNDEINELVAALGGRRKAAAAVKAAKTKGDRKRELEQIRKRKARRRNNGKGEKVYCRGLNLVGDPCRRAPLIAENWEGPEEISGLYCLTHEPGIDNETRRSFQLTGSASAKPYRRVTPGEIAHELMASAPHLFLQPYLKALGLELDPDTGEFRKVGLGLKLVGYSRGGEVKRSPYPDLVGQVNVTEKLFDRVYGKARQAVDLASQSTMVTVTVNMDPERIAKVSQVLRDAGALGSKNGNGHAEIPEVTEVVEAAEVVEADAEEID